LASSREQSPPAVAGRREQPPSLIAGSFAVALLGGLWGALVAAWSGSLVGRAFGRVEAVLGRVLGGSLLLSLAPGRSQPLETAAGSLTARSVAGGYRTSRRLLFGSFLGRWSRGALAAVPLSTLAGYRWLRVVGAAMLGAAAGQAVQTLLAGDGGGLRPTITEAILYGSLLLVGGLLLWRGDDLARRPSASLVALGWVWRSFSGGESLTVEGSENLRLQRLSATQLAFVTVCCALAALTGLLAGLASGPGGLAVLLAAGAFLAIGLLLVRPEALLVVLAAFPWIDWAARRSLGGLGAAWDELLLLGSFSLLLFGALFTGKVRLRTVPLALPLALAVTAALGSVAVSGVPSEVGLYSLRITFQPLLFFFLGYLLPRDRRWIGRTVVAFLGTSVLLALHGLHQYATGAPMPRKWLDAHETGIATRAYSIIENPNGLGAFLLLGALLAISLALAPLPKRQRLAMAAVALVLAAGIGVTFSRGAWLALIVAGFALAALAYRRLFAALVGLALLAPFVAPPAFLNRLTFVLSEQYLAKSLAAGRLLMWDVALRRIVNAPLFGSGMGTFGGTTAVMFGYHVLWVDNFYLQLAAEGGLILLLAFLWLLLRAGKGLIAATLDQEDPYLRAVSAGIFGGFVAVVLANFTAGVWETLTVGAAFWFLTGLASRPPEGDEEGEGEPRPV
jgi:hypothetical protein